VGRSKGGVDATPLTPPVFFTPEARTEALEAQDWYEAQMPGLGERFRAEIEGAVERIAAGPLHFPRILQDVRRARLHVFPYALFFRIEPEALLVIACFHASRDPQRWRVRA
jgi:plasmid stabilization system protein ParE